MVFVVESIIACIVFTLFVFLMSRDPVRVSGKHLSKSYGCKVSEFGEFHHGVAVINCEILVA